VYPAFSRQGAGLQFLHQHRGGIRPVLQMDPVLFAALEAAAHVVVGIAEDHNSLVPHGGRPPEGLLHQQPAIAPALQSRSDTDWSKGQDALLLPCLVHQCALRVHDIADHTAVQLQHQVQLRQKIRVGPDGVGQVVLRASWRVEVVKRLPDDVLHLLVIAHPLRADRDVLLHIGSSLHELAPCGRSLHSLSCSLLYVSFGCTQWWAVIFF
ncbi:hypothetical protein HHFLNI_HHFLNI_07595, partial [Dysosmobacter welbionis]